MIIDWLKDNIKLDVDQVDDVVHITLVIKGEPISQISFCVT
jgi:hypothetical protein